MTSAEDDGYTPKYPPIFGVGDFFCLAMVFFGNNFLGSWKSVGADFNFFLV